MLLLMKYFTLLVGAFLLQEEQLLKRLPLDKAHAEIRPPVGKLTYLVDGWNAGVGKARRNAGFLAQTKVGLGHPPTVPLKISERASA